MVGFGQARVGFLLLSRKNPYQKGLNSNATNLVPLTVICRTSLMRMDATSVQIM